MNDNSTVFNIDTFTNFRDLHYAIFRAPSRNLRNEITLLVVVVFLKTVRARYPSSVYFLSIANVF